MIGQQQHEERVRVGGGLGVGGGAKIVTTTTEALIPGLPDDMALLCLAWLPLEAHGRASAVSRAWRRALQSEHMWRLRRTWGRTRHLLCLFQADPALTHALMLDPSTCKWTRLPLMPCHVQRSHLMAFAAVGLGASVYVLGGCSFDWAPASMSSSTVFRFDCRRRRWERRQSMRHQRQSFACAAYASASASASASSSASAYASASSSASAGEGDQEEEVGVIVAAGGTTYEAHGLSSYTRAVEVYDVARDEWRPAPDLPGERVDAAAFLLAHPHPHPHADADADHPRHRGRDLWIMGGNIHCTDVAVVSSVSASGGEGWHRLPPFTYHADSDSDSATDLSADLLLRVGRVAVIHGHGSRETGAAAAATSASRVYALHRSSLCRYDTTYNRWEKESSLPRKIPADLSFSLVALNDELYVVPMRSCIDYHSTLAFTKEGITLVFQVYNPRKQSWRLISTEPPITSPLFFRWANMCSVEL